MVQHFFIPQTVSSKPSIILPDQFFDKKYKNIISIEDSKYLIVEDWLSKHSLSNVSIQFLNASEYSGGWVIDEQGESRIFIGFEGVDDALLFKIKFSL